MPKDMIVGEPELPEMVPTSLIILGCLTGLLGMGLILGFSIFFILVGTLIMILSPVVVYLLFIADVGTFFHDYGWFQMTIEMGFWLIGVVFSIVVFYWLCVLVEEAVRYRTRPIRLMKIIRKVIARALRPAIDKNRLFLVPNEGTLFALVVFGLAAFPVVFYFLMIPFMILDGVLLPADLSPDEIIFWYFRVPIKTAVTLILLVIFFEVIKYRVERGMN